MSSAITYKWGYVEKDLEQILKENKKFFKEKMNESIRDVIKLISTHKNKFKNINELVEILERFRDDFLSSYTLDILRSPMHTQWVDDKMNNFNALLFNVKAFIKLLDLEIGEKAPIKALKWIVDKVPKECKNLKGEIEKYVEMEQKIEQDIQDVMKLISRHKDKFKHINELVEILEKFKDDFLSNCTLDILRSPMHTQWVNDKVNEFNVLVLNVKAFIKLLDLEIGEKAYIKAFKEIVDKVPEECKNLKEEIEKYIEMGQKIEKAKEHMDIESLKKIYYELPAFAKDKEEISNILLREELIKEKKKQEITSGKQTKIDEKDEIENIKKEAKEYYEKLRKISETEAERLKSLYEELIKSDDKFRINLILEEIKYIYARKKKQFVESEILKEMISKYLSEDVPQSLKEEIKAFLGREIVSEEEYKHLNSRIIRHLMEKEERKSVSKEDIDKLSSFLSESLRKLGYQIVNDEAIERLKKGEMVEINTPFGEDYVVRIRLDEKGTLAFKFVRYVEDENNLSMYEKEKDKAIAKQWCNNQKEIIEFLRNNGIPLELKNIMEPDDRFYYEKKEKRKSIEGQTREKEKKTFKRSL
jgi:predicted metal-dependent hydrolase